jgi:hypothetical protein
LRDLIRRVERDKYVDDMIKIRNKKWRDENPEKVREGKRRYVEKRKLQREIKNDNN